MLNSRDIDTLRSDVAANCRVWLELCKEAGLAVLVTGTVRDEEYQRWCYEQGTAATPVPSFHGEKAGLAFDFCQNIKGREYSDLAFFQKAGELGELISRWLGGLGEEDRALFLRRYWNGDAVKDLALELGVRPNALTKRLLRLRESLRRSLEREGVAV